ncbi:MAG: LysE family translocator [Pseudomonadota bacterium]
MSHNILLIFSALFVNLLVVMSPGPDFALIFKSVLLHGRRAALMNALGIATGIIFHSSYIIFLLPYLLRYSHTVITLVRYFGAAYLLYLSWHAVRAASKPHHTQVNKVQHAAQVNPQHRRFFVEGLLCNVLNPKAVLFYISIFTTIFAKNFPLQLKLLAAVLMWMTCLGWFCFLSILLTRPGLKKRIQRIDNFYRYVQYAAAIVFLLFAVLLLFITL